MSNKQLFFEGVICIYFFGTYFFPFSFLLRLLLLLLLLLLLRLCAPRRFLCFLCCSAVSSLGVCLRFPPGKNLSEMNLNYNPHRLMSPEMDELGDLAIFWPFFGHFLAIFWPFFGRWLGRWSGSYARRSRDGAGVATDPDVWPHQGRQRAAAGPGDGDGGGRVRASRSVDGR